MRSSTRTTAAERGSVRTASARTLLCFLVLMFAALSAIAQTTSTIQFGGEPNALNAVSTFTIPRGAIVLNGAAINPATGAPFRHLWVGDNNNGWCRVDPDVDTITSFHAINLSGSSLACTFKLNGLSVTGGPINLDPTPRACPLASEPANCNFLYMTDARNSEGIFRINYDPNADNGHGLLDFSSIFAMAGNPTGARFQGGQTGCQFPNLAAADTAILGPDGNLWVTLKRGGQIIRINNPATATTAGFGTCNDFVQVVGLTPDVRRANGLAWIGHDLWSADGGGAFVITNADTTCQAITPGMTPTCPSVPALGGAVPAANGANSDQVYPQLNGNNLYYGISAVLVPSPVPPGPAGVLTPGLVVWVADAQGAQVLTADLINNADVAASLGAAFAPPQPYQLGVISEPGVDTTDPANLVIYTGDDPSNNGVTILPPFSTTPPGLGLGRWWQTCMGTFPGGPPLNLAPTTVLLTNNCPTPVSNHAPATPTIVRGRGLNGQIAVSWGVAQTQVPVTSYDVQTFIGAALISTTNVVAIAPAKFPATTTTIAGLTNGTAYTFRVRANNGAAHSLFSNPSAPVTPVAILAPGIPTQAVAAAANAAALVTWVPPPVLSGGPVASYTVTAIANNVVTAITSTVAAPATSAVVSGLTNGVTYTFSVHATNATGNSPESTPSNAVVPVASPVLVVTEAGPTTLTLTPTQVTYNISITNTSVLPVTNLTATDVLTVTDGAFIILGQPTQGTCGAGGIGATTITCNLGTLGGGATAKINVIVQIQANAVTNTVNVTALDNVPSLQTGTASITTAPPPPVVQVTTATVSVTGNAQVPNPNIGQAGNIVWTVSNTTQNPASNVVFTNNIPAGLQLNSIALTINNAGVFTCTFTPTGGIAVACPGAFNTTLGGLIQITTPSLGGSTKGGAKPPQTLILTVNVTPPAAVAHGAVFNSTGTMTFGPGGVDTLPNSATVKITVK